MKLILHRTHILENHVKGYLTIEGTKFSCFTLEAKSIEGHSPLKPSLSYSLWKGVYPIRLGTFSMYPLVPKVLVKGYKDIGFIKQDSPHIRPGCIAIGTNFVTEHFLEGFDDVYNALRTIITGQYEIWKNDVTLEIINDSSLVDVNEGTYSEEPLLSDDDFNFVNL